MHDVLRGYDNLLQCTTYFCVLKKFNIESRDLIFLWYSPPKGSNFKCKLQRKNQRRPVICFI